MNSSKQTNIGPNNKILEAISCKVIKKIRITNIKNILEILTSITTQIKLVSKDWK